MHVKGFSKMNPECRRSCAGPTQDWRHPASIDYLKALGITAVELLPIHEMLDEGHLVERGLRTTGATTRSATSLRRRATLKGDGADR